VQECASEQRLPSSGVQVWEQKSSGEGKWPGNMPG
jgi:hypothetical protein